MTLLEPNIYMLHYAWQAAERYQLQGWHTVILPHPSVNGYHDDWAVWGWRKEMK